MLSLIAICLFARDWVCAGWLSAEVVGEEGDVRFGIVSGTGARYVNAST
jgi:hypothetical protein